MQSKHKPGAHNPLQHCQATGLVILCTRCLRLPVPAKEKHPVCDYHRALEEYRKLDKIDDNTPFNLSNFIDRIEWNKVHTSCQPELAMLFQGFKRVNSDIARRVV